MAGYLRGAGGHKDIGTAYLSEPSLVDEGSLSLNAVPDDTCPFQRAVGEAMGMPACNRGPDYRNNVRECAAT